MALSDVQAGRIGEYLLAVYAMLTSGGRLVPFQVDADDDHRDLVVAVKGASTFASLQSKACFQLGESGFVQSNATYFEDTVPRDPSFIYVVVLVLELAPVVWWAVPAPDFNRLTSHAPARGGREVELHFRAHPDRDDLELAPELIDHGLLDQRGTEDQLEPPPSHRRDLKPKTPSHLWEVGRGPEGAIPQPPPARSRSRRRCRPSPAGPTPGARPRR